MKAPSRKVFDAELSLAGPFVMLVCLLSYFNWGFTAAILDRHNSLPHIRSSCCRTNQLDFTVLRAIFSSHSEANKAKEHFVDALRLYVLVHTNGNRCTCVFPNSVPKTQSLDQNRQRRFRNPCVVPRQLEKLENFFPPINVFKIAPKVVFVEELYTSMDVMCVGSSWT